MTIPADLRRRLDVEPGDAGKTNAVEVESEFGAEWCRSPSWDCPRYRWRILTRPLQLCARCSPGGPATYWMHNLTEHLVDSL
ncbi:hypothetical protein BRC87_02335 [Halobacteriales archaeon QS_4_66_20]|nr:MAG: hypothetical protein BRC87_02335 [Halobacteriales archaeon QS_4_66_20]